jgi:TonB family protein
MNASYVNHELTTIQTRTRRFTGVSGLFHLLFFLMVFLMRTIAPGPERLVEITWIEPVYNIPTATETTSPPPEKSTVLMSSEDRVKERFVRDKSKADVAPRPQTRKAVEDRINKRLATLQNAKVEKQVQIAAITMPTDVTRPVLAGIHSDESKPGKPGELTRQPAIGTKPVELQRTPVIASKPAIAGIRVPKVEITPEPAKPIDSTTSRTLAGASLTGPVADRPLISYTTPIYPEWAKSEGVEGSSSIYFVVLADGKIKESVIVQKTSGFEDFDRNAIDALLAWRFEPLSGSQTGEQWGTITFHYRLTGTRAN